MWIRELGLHKEFEIRVVGDLLASDESEESGGRRRSGFFRLKRTNKKVETTWTLEHA